MLRRLRRVPRRRLLLGVLVIAVLGAVLVVALGARASARAVFPVGVEQAYAGTTYAFDGVVCVRSQVTGATVDRVTVRQAAGSTTRLVRPAGGPPTLGFPVDPAAGAAAKGYRVAAGAEDCGLRLLVTPDRTGALRAGALDLGLRYGPGGLLRRTITLEPPVTLDVTATGADPRGGTT
ncbi:MAG: hypothetical protein JWN88_2707 [Frankiales bacterium]|nr:hypothetical protein [Frankiales bacterium]